MLLRPIFAAGLLPLFIATNALAIGKTVDEASPSDKKEAGSIYSDAMVDFDKNDFDKALAGFRESYARVRSPNSRFMIARTLARLGRNAEAYTELDAVIADADALGPHYSDTAHAAREKQEEIRPRVALLTLKIAHAPKGTTYVVGGDSIDESSLAKPIAVLPGETKIAAKPPAGAEQVWTKTIQAGEAGVLEVDLAEPPKDGATEPTLRPNYLLEGEAHVVGETLSPPGNATRGAGVGARLSLALSRTGFLGAEDSFALTSGADWIGTSTNPHVWIPVAVQWNIWVLPDVSVLVEPGAALMVGAGTHASPVLDVGLRYRVWRKLSAVGKVGIPGATIGVSMLL